MKNESQIRDFISNTIPYVSAKNGTEFIRELWANYEANNAEYHPDFIIDFNYEDFKTIAIDAYSDIFERQQNTLTPIFVFPKYGEGGKIFLDKPCNIKVDSSTGWIKMTEDDMKLFSCDQQKKIQSDGMSRVPYEIANTIRRRHNKSDNV